MQEHKEDEDGRLRRADTPESLTAVERRTLSLLHRILARVIPEGESGDDGGFDDQITRAEVLERGWVAEYGDEFIDIGPEMGRRETRFVMDVLDMFTWLERSVERLSASERAALGSGAERAVQFDGFDFNDRLEGRMATYARYLIDHGRWEWMAKYFDEQHSGGNSHGSMYGVYSRMLRAFEPIWERRRANPSLTRDEGWFLTPEEISEVLDARIHPSSRQ